MARRKRRRGFWTRLLIGVLAAGARHGKKHAKRAGQAAARATGPKVIRRASDEYGGKRKAGAPIPECPVNPAFEDHATTPIWEFGAMVGNYFVPFKLLADESIKALDEEEMITYALVAACRQVHSQRPIDESWPVTWVAATNDAARDHFGDTGQHLVPGLDRR
jgi:hypothetical protein